MCKKVVILIILALVFMIAPQMVTVGYSSTVFTVSASVEDIDKAGIAAELLSSLQIIPFSNTNTKYIGRWNTSGNAAVSSWGGAYFKTEFSGRRILLDLDGNADIYAIIDGSEHPVLYHATPGVLDITPANLSGETHSLQVAARFTDDSIRLKNILIDDGEKLSLPEISGKLIEFIGDSNTAGHKLPNGTLDNYSWMLADALGVEMVNISYSGITLADGDIGSTGGVGMITQFFRATANANDDTPWDFNAYTPYAVIINLGTNDALWDGVGNKSALQLQLPAFIEKIRAKYSSATTKILVLIPTTENFSPISSIEAEITGGFSQYQMNHPGDNNIELVKAYEFIKDKPGMLLSDGVHLSEAGNLAVAEGLFECLDAYLSQ